MSDDSIRTSLIQSIFTNVPFVHRLMYSHMHQYMEHSSLTTSQWRLLTLIDRIHKDPAHIATLKQLAHMSHLTPGAITQLVEPLARDGYVERRADDHDRRVSHLVLTAKGASTVKTVKRRCEEVLSNTLTELTTEELRAFLSVQQKMIYRLEQSPSKHTPKEVL